jgi:hypothetical protein
MLPLLFAACTVSTSDPALACLLPENEEDLICWTGYVYSRPLYSDLRRNAVGADLLPFSEGSIQLLDSDGGLLADAQQPYESSPSFWGFDLAVEDAGREVAIRVEGEDFVPMLWRSQAPSKGPANWLSTNGQGESRALHTHSIAFQESFINSLGLGASPIPADGTAHLWGQPVSPEDWAGAQIRVTGSDGTDVETILLSYGENDVLQVESSERVDFFFAFDIPAGDPGEGGTGSVLLETTVGGSSVATEYPAESGDTLNAMYYALPSETQ